MSCSHCQFMLQGTLSVQQAKTPRQVYGSSHTDEENTGGISMARLAAKARCNYYPLPDREAELIRSCLTFPDQ